MKSFMLIAFCSAVFFASLSSAYENNVFQVGSRTTTVCPADELVIKKEVRVHNTGGVGKLFDRTFEKTETFTPGNGQRVTMIKATDLKKNGATVHIVNGGIGQPSVTLKFQNKGHGIHYSVEIYASKKL